MSESHIKRIFEIIVGCYNIRVQARFIVTLLAMAKVCWLHKHSCQQESTHTYSNTLLFIILTNNLHLPVFQVEELDLPVSNNQNMIVKNFCQFQDNFCDDILGKRQDLEHRRMIILKGVRLIWGYKSETFQTLYIFVRHYYNVPG